MWCARAVSIHCLCARSPRYITILVFFFPIHAYTLAYVKSTDLYRYFVGGRGAESISVAFPKDGTEKRPKRGSCCVDEFEKNTRFPAAHIRIRIKPLVVQMTLTVMKHCRGFESRTRHVPLALFLLLLLAITYLRPHPLHCLTI